MCVTGFCHCLQGSSRAWGLMPLPQSIMGYGLHNPVCLLQLVLFSPFFFLYLSSLCLQKTVSFCSLSFSLKEGILACEDHLKPMPLDYRLCKRWFLGGATVLWNQITAKLMNVIFHIHYKMSPFYLKIIDTVELGRGTDLLWNDFRYLSLCSVQFRGSSVTPCHSQTKANNGKQTAELHEQNKWAKPKRTSIGLTLVNK